MANKAIFALLLLCISYSSACTLTSTVGVGLNVLCLANPCPISLDLLTRLCAGLTDTITINVPSTITLNFNTNASAAVNGLAINANANAQATVNLNAALQITNDLVITGAAVVNTAQAAVIRVGGNLQVAAQATINVAGNVTVTGQAYINGTLHLAGTLAANAAQTAWLVASSGVRLDGGASGTAVLSGNGGIDASVTLNANVTIAAGNSPGAVFVNGDLTMSSTTTLEIDMESGSSYDKLYILGRFNRNGFLYVDLAGSYRPSNGQEFIIATHASESGSFIGSYGNLDSSLLKINPKYATASTSFQYGSAATVALPFALMALCVLALVF